MYDIGKTVSLLTPEFIRDIDTDNCRICGRAMLGKLIVKRLPKVTESGGEAGAKILLGKEVARHCLAVIVKVDDTAKDEGFERGDAALAPEYAFNCQLHALSDDENDPNVSVINCADLSLHYKMHAEA